MSVNSTLRPKSFSPSNPFNTELVVIGGATEGLGIVDFNFGSETYAELEIILPIELELEFFSGQYSRIPVQITGENFLLRQGYQNPASNNVNFLLRKDYGLPDPIELGNSYFYSGELYEDGFTTEPRIYPFIYSGEINYSDELQTFPSTSFEITRNYNGENVLISEFITEIRLSHLYYNGENIDIAFSSFPIIELENNQFFSGSEFIINDLFIEKPFDIISFFSGESQESDLLTFAVFSIDFYSGENNLSTFTDNPVDLFEDGIETGENLVIDDLKRQPSFFPVFYSGSVMETGFTENPQPLLEISSLSGENLVIPDLEFDEFFVLSYSGENLDPALQIVPGFISPVYSGTVLELVYLYNDSIALFPEVYSGEIVEKDDFIVPKGIELEPEFFTGERQETIPDIKWYETFSFTFVDGSIANFWEDHIYCDSHLNYELQSAKNTYFDFTDYGKPTCNDVTVVLSDLLVYPRFYPAPIQDGSEMVSFLPKELTGFGEVTDDMLYGIEGEYFDVFVNKPLASWVSGERVYTRFEPVSYHRHCKGYIIPFAGYTNFEHDEIDNTNCKEYHFLSGESVQSSLSVYQNFQAEIYSGEYSTGSLFFTDSWSVVFYSGEQIRLPIEIPSVQYSGEIMYVAFYEPDYPSYSGEYSEAIFTVPGPEIEWVTPGGCLENQYIPRTPEGDPLPMDEDGDGIDDYGPYPVEGKPYLHQLQAICVKKV